MTERRAPRNTPLEESAELLTQEVADNATAELLRETILLEQQRLDMRTRIQRIAELLEIVRKCARGETARKGFTR